MESSRQSTVDSSQVVEWSGVGSGQVGSGQGGSGRVKKLRRNWIS